MIAGAGSCGASTPDGPADPGELPGQVPGCPAWCDGRHDAGDPGGAFHRRIIARRGDMSVALSRGKDRGPREPGSTVIIVDPGTVEETMELDQSHAIRLLGMLEAAGSGTSLLASALRTALDLLDPDAGWTRHR